MHIHFHRCFIFGWEIVIIQFSLLNYDLPLTYLVKRLPYRVSVSIQLHVASSFKNAAYPSMIFCSRGGFADEAWASADEILHIWDYHKENPKVAQMGEDKGGLIALNTGPDLCNSSSG